MVWSVIITRGVGCLHNIWGTMKQDQCREFLWTCQLPQLEEWFPGKWALCFMPDSAPCHRAKSVTKFLLGQSYQGINLACQFTWYEAYGKITKREITKEMIATKRTGWKAY